ncbi:MAG: FAD:protein FMN transferase, partial [Gammaproteobacteria bacterium]|nr:FAD:protein FMN transferase [Gammaproteobacteria bacterium]NIR94072.1 FAD:protein FMN transferase [Gammaproteobacteria bacterium]NIW43547.1 FAD:protein FMN transferase [Gammaproteobacteria bacterium]NIX56264.1 FAD:protein FMN transferase [candidate division Zixibacteria bacterium]
FHQDERPPDPPPEAAQIEKLLAELPGMQSIAIDNFNMNNTHPQLKLDLGGIAKGYALDMIMQTLPSFNIQNA